MYEELLDKLTERISRDRLLARTEQLYRREYRFGFSSYHQSAQYAAEQMQDAGFADVEMIPVPADGETVFNDHIMPLGWEAEHGRLEVVRAPVSFSDPILADWDREPKHLILGSASTPAQGLETQLITEQQMWAGNSAQGKFVLLSPHHRLHWLVNAASDLGAVGIVADWNRDRLANPDGVSWENWFTGGPNWWRTLRDEPLIGFSISPRQGEALRNACAQGRVQVRAQVTTRCYPDHFHTVTGIVPGSDRPELEIWLLAHLYEPMPDDNSAAVAACIEIGQILNEMIAADEIEPPRCSIRPIFTAEVYGYAAYLEQRHADLDNIVAALVLDGIAISRQVVDGPLLVCQSQPAHSFFGDVILPELAATQLRRTDPDMAWKVEDGVFSDDPVIGDPTLGIPTLWLNKPEHHYWHTSAQTMETIDQRLLQNNTVLGAAYCLALSTVEREHGHWIAEQIAAEGSEILSHEAECLASQLADDGQLTTEAVLRARRRLEYLHRRNADRLDTIYQWPLLADQQVQTAIASAQQQLHEAHREAQEAMASRIPQMAATLSDINEMRALSHARQLSANITCTRTRPGFPQDLARAPQEVRTQYDALALAPLAYMDGERNLLQIVECLEAESARTFSDSEVRAIVEQSEMLAKYGYLEAEHARSLSQQDIERALRDVGVTDGDLLFAHSSLSALGHIESGADAIINALLAVLGSKGTLVLPTFSRCVFFYDVELTGDSRIRPYHPDKSPVLIGRVPQIFLERDGVIRSRHPTHSVGVIGPLSEECIKDHRETDSPAGRRSPLGKLVDLGAKILMLGAPLSSLTFIHLIEDCLNLPFLKRAYGWIEREDGRLETVAIPRWLPGHRNWYDPTADERKLFRALRAAGWQTQRLDVGLGKLELINAQELFQIAMQVVGDDPTLLLCDDPHCLFCAEYQRILRDEWQPPDKPTPIKPPP